MNAFRRRWLIPVVALAAVLLLETAAAACPSCKAALGDSVEGQKLVRGYFWSICFMMAMPFTLLGGMSGYMYWLVRNARRNGPPGSGEIPRGAAAANVEQGEPVGV